MSQRRKTRFGSEGLKLSGGDGAAPASQGTWETHRSHFGAGVTPRGSWLALVCRLWCLASPILGTSAWGPGWVTQATQRPSCFQTPEGGELRWLYSLLGPGERLGHDHGHT